MTLILVVAALTLTASFLCSLLEAALYSVTPTQLEVAAKDGVFGARRFLRFRQHIERWLFNSHRCLRGGDPFPQLKPLPQEQPAVAEPVAEMSGEALRACARRAAGGPIRICTGWRSRRAGAGSPSRPFMPSRPRCSSRPTGAGGAWRSSIRPISSPERRSTRS